MGRNGEEFGEDRLRRLVRARNVATASEICEQITNSVSAFADAGAPADDRTLMVVRFLSAGHNRAAERQLAEVTAG